MHKGAFILHCRKNVFTSISFLLICRLASVSRYLCSLATSYLSSSLSQWFVSFLSCCTLSSLSLNPSIHSLADISPLFPATRCFLFSFSLCSLSSLSRLSFCFLPFRSLCLSIWLFATFSFVLFKIAFLSILYLISLTLLSFLFLSLLSLLDIPLSLLYFLSLHSCSFLLSSSLTHYSLSFSRSSRTSISRWSLSSFSRCFLSSLSSFSISELSELSVPYKLFFSGSFHLRICLNSHFFLSYVLTRLLWIFKLRFTCWWFILKTWIVKYDFKTH